MKRFKIINIFLSFWILIFMFSSFNFALANPLDRLVGSNGQMDTTKNSASMVQGTLNTSKTVPQMVSSIIKIALGLFGTVALIFVIWGGVDWLLSKGDTKKIGAARDRMVAAAIGLAIIAASYAITDFIIAQISVVAG